MEKSKRKLNFELVPDGCWYSNLRAVLSKSQWDYVKAYAKNKADGKCMICGKKTDKLDAHERWEYNAKSGTQKLVEVIAVCRDCHQTIHIGRTSLKGNMQKAEDHYIKVNGVSYVEMRKDLGEANDRQKELNKVSEWKLDISWLKTLVENGKNEKT